MKRKSIIAGMLLITAIAIIAAGVNSTQAKPRGTHCIAEIKPLKAGETSNEIGPQECFDTFSEAIYAATGGATRIAGNVKPRELTQEMLDTQIESIVPLVDRYVIGIDSKSSNYGGTSRTWYVTTIDTCTGHTWVLSSMPSGWNDVISSARSYGTCANYYHYEHTNYYGANLDCGPSCATMGVMNNATSSERWCKSCAP